MDTLSTDAVQGTLGLRPGWYAMARARKVGRNPVRFVFNDRIYVLWRTADGFACVADFCPHRGAPLSLGRVIDGQIACPYHGWRFDAAGRCTHMPAVTGPCPAARVESLAVREADGFVLVGWGDGAMPEPLIPQGTERRMHSVVRTTLADVAENILDTTHTSVLHAGYLRQPGAARIVTPRIEAGADWIAAVYPPEAAPSGVMGRLIGAGYEITDRFRSPNLAEVEYRRNGRLEFAVRFHLTPISAGRVALHAVMAVPGQGVWSWLKLFLIEMALKRVFHEDTEILEAVTDNSAAFGRDRVYVTPQDLLRRGIEAILRGQAPTVPDDVPDIRV